MIELDGLNYEMEVNYLILIGLCLYVIAWILTIPNAVLWGKKLASENSDTEIYGTNFFLTAIFTSLFIYSISKMGYKFLVEDMNPSILAFINVTGLGIFTFCIQRLAEKCFRGRNKINNDIEKSY
ncbi:hypothetical protein MOF14_12710 [Bacillus spizizenii]|nr:hypothetical protein [Bacillus spizizenii]